MQGLDWLDGMVFHPSDQAFDFRFKFSDDLIQYVKYDRDALEAEVGVVDGDSLSPYRRFPVGTDGLILR